MHACKVVQSVGDSCNIYISPYIYIYMKNHVDDHDDVCALQSIDSINHPPDLIDDLTSLMISVS